MYRLKILILQSGPLFIRQESMQTAKGKLILMGMHRLKARMEHQDWQEMILNTNLTLMPVESWQRMAEKLP